MCKARKGGFKDTSLEYMVYALLKEVRERSGVDPKLVEDIALGNVRSPLPSPFYTFRDKHPLTPRAQVSDSKSAYKLRAAALAAGYPNTSSAYSLNRFCSSGLKATADIANSISQGDITMGIAIGAELMTAGGDAITDPFDPAVLSKSSESEDATQPMGWTSENVGRDYAIAREEIDRYAAESFRRAEAAQDAGWFDDEIVPIKTKLNGEEVTLTRDEGIRKGTTAEGLGKIKAAFPNWGPRTTGGNASQLTDGGEFISPLHPP